MRFIYANRLRIAREQAGLKQGEVAKLTERLARRFPNDIRVHVKTLSSYETGERVPRLNQLLTLLRAIKVPPSEFFDDKLWENLEMLERERRDGRERRDKFVAPMLTSGGQ